MPQMNPSLWLNLLFSAYLPLLTVLIYLFFMNKEIQTSLNFKKSNKTYMNWLW